MTKIRRVSDLAAPERARWLYRSGMRFLRLSHPIKAEHDFEDNLWVERELARLSQSGVAVEDGYNTRKASLSKEADHVTNVVEKDQHGTTFADGRIPAELQGLPTLEVPREGRLAQLRVLSHVAGAASNLPPRELLASAQPMQDVMTGLEALQPLAGHGAASSDIRRLFQRAVDQEAVAQIGRLAMRIYAREALSQPESGLIGTFEFDMMVAYRDLKLNGHPVSVLLLLCAIRRAAAPAEPLRQAFAKLEGRTEPIGVQDVFNAIVTQPGGVEALVAAIVHLLSMGGTARDSVGEAADVDDFYGRQYMAMPYFKASALAAAALMQLTSDSETLERLEEKRNEAEEFVARGFAALMQDFRNATDLEAISASRRRYRQLSAERPRFARISLQKWLHDDRMYPGFWAPFITGASDDLFWDRPEAA